MYRGNVEIRQCKKCKKIFEQQRGTLAMKSSSYNKCPYCGSDTQYDEEKNRERKERIQKRFQYLYEIAEGYKKAD